MRIYCVSENQKKLDQYQKLQKMFAPHLFDIFPKAMEISEIQSVNGEDVILDKMMQIRKITKMPFIVDDVSLLVEDRAYPGALVKHILKNNNSVTLPQFLPDNTSVTVICYIGYFDGFDCHIFKGEVQGVTCYKNINTGTSLGLDALVYVNKTPLGTLNNEENHRSKAFVQMVKYIQNVDKLREDHNKYVMNRWNSRADGWQLILDDNKSYVNYENGYERFDVEVERILPLVAGSALDIGCGDGSVTRLIASNKNITNILGIDISSEMVRVASSKTVDNRICYKSETFLTTDNKYNLITSRGEILSHMHRSDVIPTLLSMSESLVTGGYLVFDYISNISNNNETGKMDKNQLDKEWILGIMRELGLVNISHSGSDNYRVSVLVFHKPTTNSLYFATSNAIKILELQSKCKNYILNLANVDISEVKHDDIIEIAKDKAKKSYNILKHPVIVTDGGIFINALNGFPGSNSKQAATLLGPHKIVVLLSGEMDRTALRRNCMVFYDGKDYKICVAEVPLLISEVVTESDYNAYPLDTILIPVHSGNLQKLTYKQMPVDSRVQFTELPFFERFISTL